MIGLWLVLFVPYFTEVVMVIYIHIGDCTKITVMKNNRISFPSNHFSSVFLYFFSSSPLMASTPSSSSSTTPSTTTTTTPLVNPSLLLLSNMSSMMTVKLDFTNYILWKHQIVVILKAYAMIGFLEDSCVAPDPFTREPNLEYLNWKSKEQALFSFINSTLYGLEIYEGSLECA